MVRRRLGDLLIDANIISKDQLDQVLAIQRATKERLGDLLIAQGLVTERQLIEVLEFQLGVPHVILSRETIDPSVVAMVPESLALRHMIFPLRRAKNRLVVAMADPLDHYAIEDLRMATGFQIEAMIAARDEVRLFVDRFYGMKESLGELSQSVVQDDREGLSDASLTQEDSPVVRLVNQILGQAVAEHASDVHFDPTGDGMRIRFRLDGVLRTEQVLAKGLQDVVTARLKIIANLNIAERRLPQDGRMHVVINGKDVDIRVSTLQTIYGEKTVLRILDAAIGVKGLDFLGFSAPNLAQFRHMLTQTSGIVLVTGPTGSGKTTTLYSALQEVNHQEVNVLTIEDPVEYLMAGVNQVPVNLQTGMTFAKGLRAILRQDPDILMIGEIRDLETAEIAIRAALTGHLVLSTIHTTGAVETITRLIDMGAPPFLVASAVSGVIAQRLVRTICPDCKAPYQPTSDERQMLNAYGLSADHLAVGRGCGLCGRTGYKGRVAIHEILEIDSSIREMVTARSFSGQIQDRLKSQGFTTLRDDGLTKASRGITTISEVMRQTAIK